MRSLGVVMLAPAFNDDPGFTQRIEDLTVEQFIAEAGIEALAVTVLPRRSRLDVNGLCTGSSDPVADVLRDLLRAVVGADEVRHAACDEQVAQRIDGVV